MSRSLKKGPYVEESLLRKVEKMQASGKKQPIKTWSRRSMVLPDFVGLTFAIHYPQRIQQCHTASPIACLARPMDTSHQYV